MDEIPSEKKPIQNLERPSNSPSANSRTMHQTETPIVPLRLPTGSKHPSHVARWNIPNGVKRGA